MANLKIIETKTSSYLGVLVIEARRLERELIAMKGQVDTSEQYKKLQETAATIGSIFTANYVEHEPALEESTVPCPGCGGLGLPECSLCNGEGWLEP